MYTKLLFGPLVLLAMTDLISAQQWHYSYRPGHSYDDVPYGGNYGTGYADGYRQGYYNAYDGRAVTPYSVYYGNGFYPGVNPGRTFPAPATYYRNGYYANRYGY